MADSVDEEIKSIIRERPGDWKIMINYHMVGRDQILREYDKDPSMRKELRRLLIGLKVHFLSRRGEK